MKYCSECGSEVRLRRVVGEQRERHVCTACGTTHYQNPRIIVCCSVTWRDKVLFCRRAQDPGRGKWTVPSGFLECGETLEEAAVRETFEETGVVLQAHRLDLQAVINMVEIQQVAVAFRAELDVLPTVTPGPECLEAAFLAEDEIPPDELAWRGYLGNSTRRWFQDLRSGAHSIYLGTLGSERRLKFTSREYRIER